MERTARNNARNSYFIKLKHDSKAAKGILDEGRADADGAGA
jgi:hypothetical protein